MLVTAAVGHTVMRVTTTVGRNVMRTDIYNALVVNLTSSQGELSQPRTYRGIFFQKNVLTYYEKMLEILYSETQILVINMVCHDDSEYNNDELFTALKNTCVILTLTSESTDIDSLDLGGRVQPPMCHF